MLSYAQGAEVPILEKTIHQVLDETAARIPDQEAVVSRHQGVRLTYRQLQQKSMRVARGLWGLGIRPGDRVGMWSTTCVEWIYLQTAVSRLGAALVNMNPAYRVLDLRLILRKSGVKAIFLHEKDQRADYAGILRETLAGEDLSLRMILLDSDAWDRMLEGGAEFPQIPVSPQEVVNIQYTSGTTGAPKGVLLTHRNLLNNGYLMGNNMRIGQQDRICAPVPLYHCFGCVIGVMVAMTHGATRFCLPRNSTPWPRWKRSRRSDVPHCMASRPCLSRSSNTPSSAVSIHPRSAPVSWPDRPVRSS
jgi:fatty-acyl-CoA synthase